MNKKEINKKSKISVGYRGKVTISLEKNNSEVSKKVLYNSGTYYLFKFICECLAGNYNNAEPLRPIYLNIYSKSDIESDVDINNDFQSNYRKNLTTIVASAGPKIQKITDLSSEIIGYSCLIKFRIPVVQINTSKTAASDINQNLNLIALYSKTNYTASPDYVPSAYLLLRDSDDNVASLIPDKLWDTDGVKDDINDYVLNIQWEMQFINE